MALFPPQCSTLSSMHARQQQRRSKKEKSVEKRGSFDCFFPRSRRHPFLDPLPPLIGAPEPAPSDVGAGGERGEGKTRPIETTADVTPPFFALSEIDDGSIENAATSPTRDHFFPPRSCNTRFHRLDLVERVSETSVQGREVKKKASKSGGAGWPLKDKRGKKKRQLQAAILLP